MSPSYVFIFLDGDGRVQTSAVETCADEQEMRERARRLAGSFSGVEVWARGRLLHAERGRDLSRGRSPDRANDESDDRRMG